MVPAGGVACGCAVPPLLSKTPRHKQPKLPPQSVPETDTLDYINNSLATASSIIIQLINLVVFYHRTMPCRLHPTLSNYSAEPIRACLVGEIF